LTPSFPKAPNSPEPRPSDGGQEIPFAKAAGHPVHQAQGRPSHCWGKLTGKHWVTAGAALQGRMLQAVLRTGARRRNVHRSSIGIADGRSDRSKKRKSPSACRRFLEALLGQAFRDLGVDRSSYHICTKGGTQAGLGPNGCGGSRAHLIDVCDKSLRRLGTDYIDVYLLHWFDVAAPLDETLRATDDLVRSRKVRYVGC
jgi:hypothetical protein